MRPILELFEEADRIRRETGKEFVFSNRFKPHREAWVLGHFAVLHNSWHGRNADLALAEKGDSDEKPADFAVYDSQHRLVAYIEVADALDPGRRPGAEYKDKNRSSVQFIPDPRLTGEDPWAHLAMVVRQKSSKGQARYKTPTWLVINLNVFASMYAGEWDAAAAVERTINEVGGQLGAITQIWLLDSTTRAVRVYPDRVQIAARP